MTLATLAFVLFGGAAVLGAVVLQAVLLERHDRYRILRSIRTSEPGTVDPRSEQLAASFVQRVLLPAMARFMGSLQRVLPGSSTERLRRVVHQAGNPPDWDAERVLRMKLLGAVVLGVALPLVVVAGEGSGARVAIAGLFGAAGGYHVPDWLLRSKAGRYQAEIRSALPDVLDILAISVEAGLSFDGAMSRVSARMSGPLSDEFNRVLREVQLGKSRIVALRDLADRTTIPELKSFVLAMVQADVYGVSVGRVLRLQAHEVRAKRRQRAEEAAQKVPVKIVFPLVFCILPALFMVLLGPAAVSVSRMIFS